MIEGCLTRGGLQSFAVRAIRPTINRIGATERSEESGKRPTETGRHSRAAKAKAAVSRLLYSISSPAKPRKSGHNSAGARRLSHCSATVKEVVPERGLEPSSCTDNPEFMPTLPSVTGGDGRGGVTETIFLVLRDAPVERGCIGESWTIGLMAVASPETRSLEFGPLRLGRVFGPSKQR
jgi:hypothetical protein